MKLLTVPELALRLGIDRRTVQRRIKAKTLGMPVLDISADEGHSQTRVREADLETYLKSREIA